MNDREPDDDKTNQEDKHREYPKFNIVLASIAVVMGILATILCLLMWTTMRQGIFGGRSAWF